MEPELADPKGSLALDPLLKKPAGHNRAMSGLRTAKYKEKIQDCRYPPGKSLDPRNIQKKHGNNPDVISGPRPGAKKKKQMFV